MSFFLITCASQPHKWDKQEKQLMWMYVAGQIVDYGQTNDIYERKDEGYYEINPVIDKVYETGGSPALAVWKVGGTLAVAGAAHHLESKWRKRLLIGVNMVVWGLVTNNFIIGLNWSF
jgi:hypothetical protein